MEGAFVGGLIAEIERELFLFNRTLCKAGVLQYEGTGTQPPSLSHLCDEQSFRRCSGLVLFSKLLCKLVELFSVFPTQNPECAREAMAEIVLAGNGFTDFRFGTGRLLRVDAVSGDLSLGRHARRIQAGSSGWG